VTMKTISQRELRNDNAKVMRDVEQGETYTVTRRGVPVAHLGPIPEDCDLRCVKPARKRLKPSELRRVTSTVSTASVVDDLRADR
jgi:prevent-host-death family protein